MNQYANDFTRTVKTYYDELVKYKPMSRAKEKRLMRQYKRGSIKAKNEILEANLRFVFDIAKHYTGRGVPISDLISEGNMGLLRAIEKFDESKDVKFISYAVWWIRQAMSDSINKKKLMNFSPIETDTSTNLMIDKIKTDDEDEDVSISERSFSDGFEEEKIESRKEQKEMVSKLLSLLNEREREIIESYYGIDGGKELTLAEIGKKYELSCERVRQIKKQGMKKLRSNVMLFDNFTF